MDKKALLLITLISVFGFLAVFRAIKGDPESDSIFNIPTNNNSNSIPNEVSNTETNPITENEEVPENQQSPIERNPLELEKKDFASIIESSEQLFCSGTIEDSAGVIDSELYIFGELIRGEFKINSDQGIYTSNILKTENNKMYIWTDVQEQGYLVTLDEDSEIESMDYIRSYISNESDLNCENADINSDIFNLPSNIEFIDIGENLQGLLGQ